VRLRSGERLGRFEIVALAGAGAMGEVYRARDPELARDVAIKVLPAEVAGDPSRLQRFEREARAVGRLDHPNLLAIHDIGRHQGAPYLVCELLEGDTLRERLAAGPLPLRQALGYAEQIADGLAAAHGRGIVHRDLKPANLFVTTDGRVKILDFGLAKLVEPSAPGQSLATVSAVTERGLMLGTVAYMAPEQAAGRDVDHRADQFAFGIVLYEMLAGHRPFLGETTPEVLTAVLRSDPEPLSRAAPDVPAPVCWIVERCLAKDPVGRYDSTRDLAKDVHSVRGRLPELTTPQAPARPGSRRWLAAPALLLVPLLAAMAAAGYFAGQRGGTSDGLAYERLTFRRGTVTAARFDPGSDAVLYSAAWDGGPSRTFLHRSGSLDPIAVGPPVSRLLSASSTGELLLLLDPFPVGPFLQAGRLARMPVGGTPRPLTNEIADAAFGPDGEPAAVLRIAGSQIVLEFPPGTQRFSTRGNTFNLRLSPDGRRVAFTSTPQWGSNEGPIVVVERDGGEEQRLAEYTGRGLAWSPSGDEIWFARGDAVHAVDLGGRERQVATFPGDVSLLDVSPDGRVLLSVEQWRFEMAGRPPDGAERDLSWLAWSVPFDLSSDGGTILFNECPLRGRCRTALRTFEARPPVVLAEDWFGMRFSPDGDWVVSVRPWDSREIDLIATRTDERRTVRVDGLETIEIVAWSPDGKSLLFNGSRPGEGNRIFRIGLDGGEPEPVTPGEIGFGFFAPSADGRLAFSHLEGGIAIHRLDGGEPIILDVEGQPIQWSADGRSLYTATLMAAPAVLRRIEIATDETEVVASLMPPDPAGVAQVSPVAVTPNGEAYVYGFIRRLSTLFIVDGMR
jgi:eukaryotic-like serine/threonine-protein kinase